MRLSKNELANAFALATGALWIICSAFVAILPDFSYKVMSWWVHGMNMDGIGSFNLGWSNFFWGGVTLIISLWAVGYILGWSFEIVSGKSAKSK